MLSGQRNVNRSSLKDEVKEPSEGGKHLQEKNVPSDTIT